VLRVAWFTPLPPVHSGISQYNAELLPALAGVFEITAFIDVQPGDVSRPDPRVSVRSAHDFVWMQFRHPFDLVVYQLGNAVCHDYMWAYMARYPGLVVLHDGQLHLARGRRLRMRRSDDYQQEFAYNHPGVHDAVIDLAIRGRLGSHAYLWPMRRVIVQSARMVAVHSRLLADQIQEENPGARVEVVEMGVPDQAAVPGARQSIRSRHGIPPDAVLFMTFGEITPEKRITQVVRQLGAIARSVPNAYLLLAGRTSPHYDAEADIRTYGVSGRVVIAGYVAQDEIADYLTAADVCVCLRWPTSRETSAAWLRCLAAGRPTIITDLAHTTDVPSYDPRSWTPLHTAARSLDADGWPVRPEPACVSIDILDEDHSLQLAMARLATDQRLRGRLGQHARELWRERFRLEGMAVRYRALIGAAAAAPMPDAAAIAGLPGHFRLDGTEDASRRLREAGLTDAEVAAIWSVHSA
jgi:glycosyltransferase involved in cell wall biosynthesis